MKIFLVRHGETEWNRVGRFQGVSDIPLNQKGKAQARSLGLALKAEPIKAVYTSPLIRAKETAEIIRRFHPTAPMIEIPELKEMNLGAFEGMDSSLWKRQYPEIREQWRHSPASVTLPKGENLKSVQIRAVAALEQILLEHRYGETILICSHNFVIHAVLCYALGISLNNFRDIKQDTAAVNILHKQEDRLVVKKVNEVSHLTRRGAIPCQ